MQSIVYCSLRPSTFMIAALPGYEPNHDIGAFYMGNMEGWRSKRKTWWEIGGRETQSDWRSQLWLLLWKEKNCVCVRANWQNEKVHVREREIMEHRTAERQKKLSHWVFFLKECCFIFPLEVPAESFEGLMWEVARWGCIQRYREGGRKEGRSKCAASPFLPLLSFPSVSHFSRRFVRRIFSVSWRRGTEEEEKRREEERLR